MRPHFRILVLVCVTCSPAITPAAEPGEVVEYTAEYEVRYNGRRVARAEFSVARDSDEVYVFDSVTNARGIWRLAAPNPAVESSRFRIENDRLVPLSFRYEDGSRKGEDNYALEFDYASGQIHLSGAVSAAATDLADGILDRGSLQVALMRDLGACNLPGPYRYVDEDATVRTYAYERLEDLALEMEAGNFETVRFSQHREGSSRTTVLWLAPDLGFIPVRIEQIRNGEVETVFSMESFSGIERSASPCSSLG